MCFVSPRSEGEGSASACPVYPRVGGRGRRKPERAQCPWQLRAELEPRSSPVAGLAMSELLLPCVLPSPPAMGKSAHVAISAALHRENPAAAVSSWAADCLQCLFTHHHFGLRSRALRSSQHFGFCTRAHLFPGTCSWACLSAPTVTQLLGSTSGSQIQTHSSRHQKGMCTRTSMRTPHASSQAERRIKAVQGAKGNRPRVRGGRLQWGYETPTCTGGSWADAIPPGAELVTPWCSAAA